MNSPLAIGVRCLELSGSAECLASCCVDTKVSCEQLFSFAEWLTESCTCWSNFVSGDSTIRNTGVTSFSPRESVKGIDWELQTVILTEWSTWTAPGGTLIDNPMSSQTIDLPLESMCALWTALPEREILKTLDSV